MSKNLAKDYSASQERSIARLLNGRVQSNSGGTRFGGGDVHTAKFLIEAKTPTKDQTSFSIKSEWLDKMSQQAFEQGKVGCALAFRFGPKDQDFFVINGWLMKALVDYFEGGEET